MGENNNNNQFMGANNQFMGANNQFMGANDNANTREAWIKTLKVVGSNTTRSLPVGTGDVIHFNAYANGFIKEHPADKGIDAWTEIVGVDGSLSATQLCRRFTGIPLDGGDNTERLQDLVGKYADENGLFTILVVERIDRGTGADRRTYYRLNARKGNVNADAFKA